MLRNSTLTFLFSAFLFSTSFAQTEVKVFKGTIWNMEGPNASAWDLKADKALTVKNSGAGKDLVNTTTEKDLPLFKKELKALNGTVFMKLPKLDFEKQSLDELPVLVIGKKWSDHISKLKANDVYVVRLRGEQVYALIKITKIEDDKKALD
ncbi:MAG TPA: hypothetical protein VK750_05300, partial [Cytophagaceae bacterium]|nr:hypothetical protein [Cytophagaceae bacterium]